MSKRRLVLSALGGVVVLGTLGFTLWLMSLPKGTVHTVAPSIAQSETDAMLAALKPPKRQRPLIAIIGVNAGTEVTDYVMPYGILSRADVAVVLTVATQPGPLQLYPALRVQPHSTVSDFDAKFPEGADFVIVPAMHRDDDPQAIEWIRQQAAKGAIVIGVCAGAKVVAETGLMDGKKATTHWYYLREMLKRHPTIRYVSNRRMVADRGIVTTTGISASMPMSLTLIEAIAGRAKAMEVAAQLGLPHWDARHDSAPFQFTRPFAMSVLGNVLRFWHRDRFSIELQPAVDEVSLALVADMWSRTYRSKARTFSSKSDGQYSRNGLLILPDEADPSGSPLSVSDLPPARMLDDTLRSVGARYGAATASMIAMQLEYPYR